MATVVVIFVGQLILGYFGQWRYHYPVAPGDDIYNHLNFIASLQAHPTLLGNGSYPPGFHYFVIGLSLIFHTSALNVLTWLWPALLLASGLAILALTKQLFGPKAAIIAYCLYAFLSLQPLQTATDGTLANLFASNILLPLTLLAWAKAWLRQSKQKTIWMILTVIGAGAVIYSHHFSTVILLGVLSLSSIGLIIDRVWQRTHRLASAILAGLGTALVWGLIIGGFWLSPLAAPVRGLANLASHLAADNKSWPITAYFTRISVLIGITSLAGIGYYLWLLWRNRVDDRTRTGLIIILVWAGIYLIGSRTSLVGEPERLGRDFAMPAVILAGLVISQLQLNQFGQAKYVILAALIIVGGRDALIKTRQLVGYNPMIRYSQADALLRAKLVAGTWPGEVYVWPRNPAWQYVSDGDVKINIILPFQLAAATLRNREESPICLLASVYKPGTWPPELQSQTELDQLAATARVKSQFVVEDSTKLWYSFCKPKYGSSDYPSI